MTTTLLTKHVVLADGKPSKKQLTGNEMGSLVNSTKQGLLSNSIQTKTLDLKELLKAFSEGQNIILSDVNLIAHPLYETEKDESKKIGHTSIEFVSSDIFAIDIDDEKFEMDPQRVFKDQGGKAVGMFYTFSHGLKEKGNRYRLVYRLDRKVTDVNEFKAIVELVQKDLIGQGVPGVDRQAKDPKGYVRGGKHGYKLHPNPKNLEPEKYLKIVREQEAKKRKEIEERAKQNEDKILPPFESLKEAAETIGYIPLGEGKGEMWVNIMYALGHEVQLGGITDDQGYELHRIISGPEESRHMWEYYRDNAEGSRTIASFIQYAKESGYDFHYSYSDEEVLEPTYELETIEIDQYVPKEEAKRLIERNERLLVDSPTGSGKTTAFLEACKELAMEDTVNFNEIFYILAAPTQALVDQQAKRHDLLAIKGQTRDVQSKNGELHNYVKEGNRVFVTTYNMTSTIIKSLRSVYSQFKFRLVVDEEHKLVTDYGYRYLEIKSLETIAKTPEVVSYTGLSGTTEEVYKNDFDRVIEFKKDDTSSPAKNFKVLLYKDQKDEIPHLVETIKAFTKETDLKMLVFIQSIPAIKKVSEVLNNEGIKTVSMTKHTKNTPEYRQLVEKETIPEDVRVVLATSVIADGVNIQNKGQKWSVITVSTPTSSRLFNINVIRQMSNRLRNEYIDHILYSQDPKHEKEKARNLYNLEGAFKHRLDKSEELIDEFNELVNPKPHDFWRSAVEKERGVYQEGTELVTDRTHIRHKSSQDREKYYTKYRKAFIHAVSKVLAKDIPDTFVTTDLLHAVTKGAEETQRELTAIHEKEKLSEEEKRAAIEYEYTEEVHKAYETGDREKIEEFETKVVPEHANCVKKTGAIYGYEVCLKAVKRVNNRNQTYDLFNETIALTEYVYNERYNIRNKTWNVLEDLLDINEPLPNKEYKEELETIGKRHRVNKKEMKRIEKMVEVKKERSKKERYTRVERKTFETVAEKYDISIEEVIEGVRVVAETVNLRGVQRKRLLKAVLDQELILNELISSSEE